MIHLHRSIALVMVWLCAPHFSVAQHKVVKDTTECSAYLDSVKLYSYRYDENDSLRYFAEVLLDCSRKFGDDEAEIEALSVLGVTCIRANNYPEALQFFEMNRRKAIEMKNVLAEAGVLINIASVYTTMDSSQKAMELLMNSARIFEKEKDSTTLIYVYTNIGILFGKIREREEQLLYCKKAFRMAGGIIKDKRTLTLASNLAVNYLNSGIADTAEILGLQVLEKSREFGNSKTTSQILSHLANIANKNEKYEQAILYANEVMQFEGSLKHDQTFAAAYVYRGSAYLKLGKTKQAISDLEKALEYSEKEHSLQRKELVLKSLHLAYAQAGMFEKAYDVMLQYKEVADTLAGEENVRILNDIETKYETEKKEQQLRELSQQNLISELKIKERNAWIIGIIILALLIASAVFFVSRQRLLKQRQEALENRLLSLRVQLNPHFIFNALTAVQNYMLSGKDLREATRYLSNFAKVMRAFLEYNQEEQISLDKEIHALELYIGIQKLRFSNGFLFELELDEEIVPEETLVPPMMLQPFIENAIEHGIRNKEDGLIRLQYRVEGDFLLMIVSDNGIGRNRSANSVKAAEKTSLATKITEERISLLNRKANGQHSFQIADLNSDGTGTVVTFKIPISLS